MTETGAVTAARNEVVANWFSIARSIWNMHDALLIEQRRTNQLLEALIDAVGGDVPDPADMEIPTLIGEQFDPATGLPIRP